MIGVFLKIILVILNMITKNSVMLWRLVLIMILSGYIHKIKKMLLLSLVLLPRNFINIRNLDRYIRNLNPCPNHQEVSLNIIKKLPQFFAAGNDFI